MSAEIIFRFCKQSHTPARLYNIKQARKTAWQRVGECPVNRWYSTEKREINSRGMTDTDRQNISELAEKAGAGHRASLESLISLFHKDIFRMAFYRDPLPDGCRRPDSGDFHADDKRSSLV